MHLIRISPVGPAREELMCTSAREVRPARARRRIVARLNATTCRATARRPRAGSALSSSACASDGIDSSERAGPALAQATFG